MATSGNYESSAKFANIVDDCLWYTLEHLSYKEKFGVMRVCKRWRKVTTEMIEKGDCLELEMVPIEISPKRTDCLEYNDEESIERNLKSLFGKQAEKFINYKLENVKKVSIKRCGHALNSNYQPLTLCDIGWLFKRLPRLKSLSLTGTTMLNYGVRSFQVGSPLSLLSTRLKSFRLESFEYGWWLSSLLEGENVLEELWLRKGSSYQCLEPPKLSLLKKIRHDVHSLEAVSNVIENCHGLLEIRIIFSRLPNHLMFNKILFYFARFTQLKTLKLGFLQGLYGFGVNELLDDELHFPSLQRFKLSGISVENSMFEKILANMPAIRSLQLRNVYVSCTCNKKICRNCPKLFMEKIASLEHLNELHLNYRIDTGCNSPFVDVIERLIDEERMPMLRKLRCTLAKLFSPSLFEAFANMAWETQKESFIMIAPFDDQPNKDELLSFKPRNLQAIHARRTSKTEVFKTARKSINVR